MKINLNGNVVEIQSQNLMELVTEKGFDPEYLVAEYNYKVVKQENWLGIKIAAGDNIELLSFVGGG